MDTPAASGSPDSPRDPAELHSQAQNREAELHRDAERALTLLRDRAPQSIQEAVRRFRSCQRVDPFPDIPPGLLTCDAFCSYIARAGIVYPFGFKTNEIKLATIDLPLQGRAVWWDAKGARRELEIREETTFVLKRNSIAFVTLGPYLQLPDYLALRFNLRVRHAYQGLLLGTGPLVDPGYQGYLAIPLHNLTNNDYTFCGGEGLIAVEFTKLVSPAPLKGQEDAGDPSRPMHFVLPFPEPARPLPSGDHIYPIAHNLRKARASKVDSSLPHLGTRIRRLRRWMGTLSTAAVIAGAGVLLAVGGTMWQATSEMRALATRASTTADQLRSEQQILDDSLTSLARVVATLRKAACNQATAVTPSSTDSRDATELECARRGSDGDSGARSVPRVRPHERTVHGSTGRP